MFCSKCGKKNEDTALFCGGCGAKLKPVSREGGNQSEKNNLTISKNVRFEMNNKKLGVMVVLSLVAVFVASGWFIKKQDTVSPNNDLTVSEGDSFISERDGADSNVTDAEASEVTYNPRISGELWEAAANVRSTFRELIGFTSVAVREEAVEKLGIKVEEDVEYDFLYSDWIEMLINEGTNEIIVNMMTYGEEAYHLIIKPSDGDYKFSVIAFEPGFVKMEQTPAAMNYLCFSNIHNKYSTYEILRKLDTYDAETDDPLDECMEFTEFEEEAGIIYCNLFQTRDEDYMYPIALRSETDGENLVRTYLDAERDEDGNVLRYLKRVIEFEPEESEYGYQVKSLRTEELELEKYVEKLELEELEKKFQKLSLDDMFWDYEEDELESELEKHLNQWEEKMYELIDLVGELDSDVKQKLENEFREYLKEVRDEDEELLDDEAYAYVYWDSSYVCRALCYKLIYNGLIENQIEACYPERNY